VSTVDFALSKGPAVEKSSVKMRWIRWTQRVLLVAGAILVGVYGAALVHRGILSHMAVEEVRANHAASQEAASQEVATTPAKLIAMPKPDFTLWSPVRVAEFKSAMAQHGGSALGILRIPTSRIEAPIFQGADDLTLNKGVGLIPGTDPIGSTGNTGIAGHRDGFFRGLKDIKVGDRIEIETATKPLEYVVDRIVIVDPQDVSVLQERGHPVLTLVTCYPFYVLGSAPKRFIVEAKLIQGDHGV
jgi:sortase A